MTKAAPAEKPAAPADKAKVNGQPTKQPPGRVISDPNEVAQLRRAVQSVTLAENGARSARARGAKADADVLQAQQQHVTALRDWRKARYEAVVSQFKLKAACGQLSGDDLVALREAPRRTKQRTCGMNCLLDEFAAFLIFLVCENCREAGCAEQ